MRAIVYTESGSSAVLHEVDRPAPEPGPGEVRVRVVVSGVNPTDWKSRAGTSPDGEQVPNQDGAGVVDRVGEGVERFRVGDRVWLWDAAYRRADGTAQEQVVLPEQHVMPLPEAASFELGAALGIPALTAHLALRSADAVPEPLSPGSLDGRTVLVAGGAGAVGHAAIELAVWAGATVITTVSSDTKAALARSAGAHHVIDYRTDDVAARIRDIVAGGVDLVVEVNPLANADLDAAVTAAGGTIATYATDRDGPMPVVIGPSMGKNLRYRFLLTYTVPDAEKRAALDGVQSALEAGALRIGDDAGLPVTRFPLTETAAAHDAVEQGAVGKVLIDVQPA